MALLAMQYVPLPAGAIELEVPAVAQSLASVREELGRWLARADADPREAHRIQVACGEACTNAVEHAYGPGEGRVRVEAVRRGQDVELTVKDTGRWRSPRGGDRGRGLQLMSALMKNVKVVRGDGGTTVVLRHPLGSREADATADPPTNH